MTNNLNVVLNFGTSKLFVGKLYLSEKLGQCVFEYDDSFVAQGHEISPLNLPLQKDSFVAANIPGMHNIHGVFADSLPDAWGRRVQDMEFLKIGLYNPTTLDRLAFVGKYGIGALQYEPAMEFELGTQITSLAELRKSTQGIIDGEIEKVSHELMRIGGSAGGAHPKFLVDINKKDHTKIKYASDSASVDMVQVLLKVPPKDDVWQRIEYIYCQMAKKSGINIPKTYLIYSKSNKAFFAIERFDRTVSGERFHTHTFANFVGYALSENKSDYLELCRTTFALCKSHPDVIEVYRRMVFNYLGGNQDDHGKNFSFIMDNQGRWRLSPAYDLGYSENGGIHAMPVNGKPTSLTAQDLEHFALKVDIKNWKKITEEVITALTKWMSISKTYNLPTSLRTKISTIIKSNCNRVERHL